jgi:hypothetical protein
MDKAEFIARKIMKAIEDALTNYPNPEPEGYDQGTCAMDAISKVLRESYTPNPELPKPTEEDFQKVYASDQIVRTPAYDAQVIANKRFGWVETDIESKDVSEMNGEYYG